jgi:hypothetical protein
MLGLDLLFNKELIRSGLIIDGTLAVISGKNPSGALFTVLSLLNAEAKDSKKHIFCIGISQENLNYPMGFFKTSKS